MVFIGEGTYGCVFRPPIKCKNGKKYGTGKVSKLMTDRAAQKEVEEYDILKNVDPQELYYPGPPISCKADPLDASTEIKPNDCKLLKNDPNIDNYSLLIYNDGGVDLNVFCESELDTYLAIDPQKQTDLFFLNAHNLLKGVQLFIKEDFIHHDIKPGNIVFEPSTYKFNFIDFGLSKNYSVLFNELIMRTRAEPFHWSYPLEFGFFNSSKPFWLATQNTARLEIAKKEILEIFNKRSVKENKYGIRPFSFFHTFTYMENMLSQMTDAKEQEMISSAFDGLKSQLLNHTYQGIVANSLKYSDIYSLGFTMNHLLNSFYKKGVIPDSDYAMYHQLFSSMFNFNLDLRENRIDEILTSYERILQDTGVLSRLGERFVNHTVLDALPSVVNRRINKCPPNTVRNNKGRCVKQKSPKKSSITQKSLSAKNASITQKSSIIQKSLSNPKTRKLCPPGKELNPLTNRCINKCSSNTVCNNKGRYVKR
jgi:serine/threonine protein kinase